MSRYQSLHRVGSCLHLSLPLRHVRGGDRFYGRQYNNVLKGSIERVESMGDAS